MAARLEGKIAVVTGAAGGIGSAAVCLFASEGARVVALDVAAGPESPAVLSLEVDATDPEQVGRAFDHVRETFGRLDVLLNVAGASGRRHGDGPVHACSDAGWEWVLAANLGTMFHCCRAAVPLMLQSGGGSIISLGSVLALSGHEAFDTHAYAASKGAIVALSRAMAVRYAADHIRVNVLCPGLIRTPMSRRAQEDPGVLAALEQLQPLTGDFGEPEDVAAAALYLASDESRFVTGVVLPVDGGWTAR